MFALAYLTSRLATSFMPEFLSPSRAKASENKLLDGRAQGLLGINVGRTLFKRLKTSLDAASQYKFLAHRALHYTSPGTVYLHNRRCSFDLHRKYSALTIQREHPATGEPTIST